MSAHDAIKTYLRSLTPETRRTVLRAIERSRLKGDDDTVKLYLLGALRDIVRENGEEVPRVGSPARAFFAHIEPS